MSQTIDRKPQTRQLPHESFFMEVGFLRGIGCLLALVSSILMLCATIAPSSGVEHGMCLSGIFSMIVAAVLVRVPPRSEDH